MTEACKAEAERLAMFIEHLLMVIDDRIPEGTDQCQICENARQAADACLRPEEPKLSRNEEIDHENRHSRT